MTPLKSRIGKLEWRHTDTASHFCNHWPTRKEQIDWLAFRMVCLDLYAMEARDSDTREREILAIVNEVLQLPWRCLKPSPCPQKGIKRLKNKEGSELKITRMDAIFDAAHDEAEHYLKQAT